ncbi:TadE/TadG family type IV pilus assembly protein [Planctomicrobium sp. SH664]|uniref:TadE/TadG family type IV pilus assembly protein n=1 Tax=Planctomicrobium sp. SH664 TaxID=3448125 RepID=UPI003F5B9861
MKGRILDRPSRRSGAVVVEMALILPFFLTVLWAIVEFGRAMMVGQLMTTAARQGTRAAILEGSSNGAVTTEVRSFLVASIGGRLQASDITVVIEVTPAAGNPDPGNQLAAAGMRDVCKVTCTVPYSRVGYMTGRYLKNSKLRGTCSMRHE